MFYHVVLIQFHPGVDDDFLCNAETYAQRVRNECDGVVAYFFAPNTAARADGFSHAVVGIYDSAEAHEAYQVSPVHQEMKEFLLTRIKRIVAFDADRDDENITQTPA